MNERGRRMTFALHGLGTAVPVTRVDREETQRIAFALGCPSEEQATWLPNMYAHTGIGSRNVFYPAEVVRDVLEHTNRTGSIFLPKGTPEDRGPTTGQRMEHYALHAAPLAVRAARAALEEAGARPA